MYLKNLLFSTATLCVAAVLIAGCGNTIKPGSTQNDSNSAAHLSISVDNGGQNIVFRWKRKANAGTSKHTDLVVRETNSTLAFKIAGTDNDNEITIECKKSNYDANTDKTFYICDASNDDEHYAPGFSNSKVTLINERVAFSSNQYKEYTLNTLTPDNSGSFTPEH